MKAEAIRLYASGHAREALAEAQKQLALLPEATNPVPSANFETVELLERIRTYSTGLDTRACASATERLVRIWDDLKSVYPQSEFVRGQVERVHALSGKGCVA
jgi:hypothetical protein